MITVYELERKVPNYYGLCGLKTERAISVVDGEPYGWMKCDYAEMGRKLRSEGWEFKRSREFPTKLKYGGFIRYISEMKNVAI